MNTKQIIGLVLMVLAVMMLVGVGYYSMTKSDDAHQNQINQTQERVPVAVDKTENITFIDLR